MRRTRNLFVAAIVGAAALGFGLTDACLAKDAKVKVPDGKKIEKAVGELFAADPDNTAAREQIFLKIDKALAKDKKGVALRSPAWWAAAIHAGRFASVPGLKPKKVAELEFEVRMRGNRKTKAKLAYHGAATYKKSVATPLLLTILDSGQDAKAFVKALVDGNETLKKGWIIAAIADSKDFPVVKEPTAAINALVELRNGFNIDSDRWFVQGVGKAATSVQLLASELVPDRIAGIVLRTPAEAKINDNSGMFATFVIHDKASKGVADAYTKLDAEKNKAVPAGAEADAAMMGWLTAHPGRAVPTSYDFETTIQDGNESGPDWTGSLRIVSPGKYGEVTKVSVAYDREKNTASVSAENLSEFLLYMNDQLLDLDKPVTVIVNGEEVVTKTFERQMREMFQNADDVGEYGRIFPASYRGVVQPAIEAPPEEGAEGGEGKEEGK